MATEKQYREHLKRIWSHWYRLQRALDYAHRAGVIDYASGKYCEEAPGWASWELRQRIERTTQKGLAEAVQESIRKDVK